MCFKNHLKNSHSPPACLLQHQVLYWNKKPIYAKKKSKKNKIPSHSAWAGVQRLGTRWCTTSTSKMRNASMHLHKTAHAPTYLGKADTLGPPPIQVPSTWDPRRRKRMTKVPWVGKKGSASRWSNCILTAPGKGKKPKGLLDGIERAAVEEEAWAFHFSNVFFQGLTSEMWVPTNFFSARSTSRSCMCSVSTVFLFVSMVCEGDLGSS
jgi:hypothetical protein